MLRQASVLSKKGNILLLHTPSRGCSTRYSKQRQQRHPSGVRSHEPGAGGVAWLTTDSAELETNLDSVIVLGGGLTESGGLPKWVIRRLETAADILRQQQAMEQPMHTQAAAEASCPILCLGGGTPHKPAVLVGKHVLHEATACADYLVKQGIDAGRILKESASYDTVGNGYFAATIHAVPADWRKCAVVTSAFHMPRARAIFDACFQLAGKSLWNHADRFQLSFYAASDEGVFPEDVLQARHAREAASLELWKSNVSRLHSLKDLHDWLHKTHLCYAVARQREFGDLATDNVNQKALATY